MIFADYDPGTLTGFYVLLLSEVVFVFCILGAGLCLLLGNRQALKKWGFAAIISFVAAIGLCFGTVMLGRIFHWL